VSTYRTRRYRYAPRGTFRAWLAGIVIDDAPNNGGFGLLADCAECGGAGALPATGAEHYAGTACDGYAICTTCDGSGFRCKLCAGRGWRIIGEGNTFDCSICKGTGYAAGVSA
jgi:hypothetical protein